MPIRIEHVNILDEESYQAGTLKNEEECFVKQNCGSLLSRQWYYVLPIVVTIYIILQTLVYSYAVCDGGQPIELWTQNVVIAIAGCFILSVSYHAILVVFFSHPKSRNLTTSEMSYPRAVYASAATLSLIAAISACIKIGDNYQSICTDPLGMQTFSSQWPEWLVAVPLLGYITVALEDKLHLEREDIILICLMFSMIFLGFLATIIKDRFISITLFLISFCCIFGNFYVAFKSSDATNKSKTNVLEKESKFGTSKTMMSDASWAMERVQMKGRLAWLLIYVLPLFPATYALALLGIFSRDQMIASNMICSVFAKIVFCGILSLESLFVQMSQNNVNSRKKLLNKASLDQYPLRGRTIAFYSKEDTNMNLNTKKYDSLNQVNSVEDEVNFNLIALKNDITNKKAKNSDGTVKGGSAEELKREKNGLYDGVQKEKKSYSAGDLL